MSRKILDKLFVKLQQFLKMEHLKLPTYLNTMEKYNEMIYTTDTVKKYEEVFYTLLEDESLPLLDILTLMRCIERDVILVHGIKEVGYLLELTESFIKYMISMSAENDKNNAETNINKEAMWLYAELFLGIWNVQKCQNVQILKLLGVLCRNK